MKTKHDKTVIDHWIRLYNRANSTSFSVTEWPDEQMRTGKAIDALCHNANGEKLAVEHTLIQAFSGEKADEPKFLKTLASLEEHPSLIVPGFTIHASQPVGSVPNGLNWTAVRDTLLEHLQQILPELTPGGHVVRVPLNGHKLQLTIFKEENQHFQESSFSVARIWPGDPGHELVLTALRTKAPKLAKHSDAKKVLLLEKSAIAGTIESQFEQMPLSNDEVKTLLGGIDEIWCVNTTCLARESIIFSNDIWPTVRETICSLNVNTGEFWRRPY